MNTFRIKKKTGTYAELLEAYGLANLLSRIFDSTNFSDTEILIKDKDLYYEIITSNPITDEILENTHYFPIFKFIKQKEDSNVCQYSDYYDYPVQKKWKNEKQNLLLHIFKDYKGKENKNERERRINEVERIFDREKHLDVELDVYSQISSPNNFSSFEKLFQNIFVNKTHFSRFIKEIVLFYGNDNYIDEEFDKLVKDLTFTKKVTATQLYNPNQGQGLNKLKADGLNRINFYSLWICECMKISGALSDMICQKVKVGNSYDMKVFVPEYKEVNYHFKSYLLPNFKKHLKGNTPIKIDILNILLLSQTVIEHSSFMGRRKKVKDIVLGLHSVYQKDLGKNKAVVNIGFIQVPSFIEISNKNENQIWIDILKEQRQIVGNINELGDTTSGLLLYRNFISGSDLNCFLKFMHWYAIYLTSQLSNKKYTRSFSIETLNKFYKCMDTNELKLSEIILNVGFKAVAGAIRKSTVTLQYTPKENRMYDIRYGVAQTLQNKSKSKEDLAEFIGEFIALYNSETARQAEKTGSSFRTNVREDELAEFYTLLDNAQSSKLIGALLASYGFALSAKKVNQEDSELEMLEISEEE
ncbi:MAG: hypothetical protein ACK5HZ_12785 [Macellibacteroides fermentans]|uniref:hypothetical protein n=1 Tax=Macellibacteroides fermentans TaxID=879969 RepID=UPI003ACC3537